MSWLFVILILLLASIKKGKEKEHYTVSIVIPAYNEDATVANVIGTVNSIDYVNEVIVVDDGSHDRTVEEAKLAGATVISHASNQGKGAALKTGFRHSKGDIIAFIDADIHNLSTDKIDSIIMPILKGKTDITKTKFARESGRVTELTAKPLLKFFFPEVTFDQPLSGQFAGKRSVLNKIKFEKDYGVDVGIVLDADAYGLKIQEVDIGEIKHDLSPLSDLNIMATEVVRTIVDRALEYGRVTMIDSLGNYIRLSILGLSIITLSLFIIFFVQAVPLIGGILIGIAGLVIFLYFIFKVIRKTIYIFGKKSSKKGPKANRNLLKSFIKMHSPLIFSGLVLILMISTFFSAATFDNGVVSIEPTSRNLIIGLGLNYNGEIAVRGPYTVDSALENEKNLIRMPQDA
ncbi:MAG: glycosyltransferase, partial [Methanobacteriaceae archaeon]